MERQYRVAFASRVEQVDGREVGFIEVLVAGPGKADAVYDMAAALRASGRITEDELTVVWDALAILDTVAEDVGLDGWDYRPDAAPDGLINAAMESGWGRDGKPDPIGALAAAMRRARAGVDALDLTQIVNNRSKPRCPAVTKRTGKRCVRRAGHPGAHRGSH